MARTIHRLTPEKVRRKSKMPGLYGDGGGLYLRVTPPSACSWVFRYMLDRSAREMGLGSYPDISLADARELARKAREMKAGGRDPIDMRRAEWAARRLQSAKSITFRQCAEAYIATHRERWKNAKHAAQWTASLEAYAMPIIGDLPVGDVDRALVVKVLEPIWKAKPETASRVRGRIEAVLDWAEAREYRTGANPARWKGSLEKLFPARHKTRGITHHAALPYRETPAFMAALQTVDGVGAEALRFTILTAARTGETIGACWPEIDLERATWTIPATRTKTSREHRVPLCDAAVKILRARHGLTGGKNYIFPGQRPKKPLSNMAMLATLDRMGRGDLTVHGFRSTFRDWAEEMTNFPGSVAEAALGHVVGDKVEAAYRRGDLFEKRRKLMAAWGSFCMSPAQPAAVVPIRKITTQ